MKRLFNIGSLMMLVLVLASSCCRQDVKDLIDPFEKREGNINVAASIAKHSTRALNNKWQANDEIGIYPFIGDVLSNDNIIDNQGRKGNRKYVTVNGDGRFTSAVEGIWLGKDAANMIAYYPYNAGLGTSFDYKFDTSDQSNHAKIDLLYSNNVKGVTHENNKASFVFDHALTLVVFNVTSEVISLEGKNFEMTGALVDGSMNLVDGSIATGTTRKNFTKALTKVSDSKYQVSFILPPQDLSQTLINVVNVGQNAKPVNLVTENGHKHVVEIIVDAAGQLIINEARINDWKDGKSPEGPIVLDPITDNPINPDPEANKLLIDAPFSSEMAPFIEQSVKGDQKWQINTQYKNVNISGFANGASHENEDWLISPAMNLTNTKVGRINFNHTWNKGDVNKMKEELTVWFTTDYTDDVTKATWTKAEIPTYPAGTNWTVVATGDILFPAEVLGKANVRFAMKYTCTATASGTWQIKELKTYVDEGELVGGTQPEPEPEPQPEPQPEPEPIPAEGLLFPGSNFEDFDAFKASLNTYGLKEYAVQSGVGEGRNESKALKIKMDATPSTKNDNVFTATLQENTSFAGKTKIVFYLKGTAASKSLSLNVYVGAGSIMGTDYKCYNLGDFTNDAVFTPTDANVYKGSINTGGEWKKVTLDISGLTINSTKGQNLFALKVGNKSAYDILIDDITIE